MILAYGARSSLLVLTMLFSLRPFSQLVTLLTLIAAKYSAKYKARCFSNRSSYTFSSLFKT